LISPPQTLSLQLFPAFALCFPEALRSFYFIQEKYRLRLMSRSLQPHPKAFAFWIFLTFLAWTSCNLAWSPLH
jgi:hypothetical protein